MGRKKKVEPTPETKPKVWRVAHIPPGISEPESQLNTEISDSRGNKIILSNCQQKIWDCLTRFIFVQSGRRFGKTTLMQEWLKNNAQKNPNTTWWYVAPTFKQAKSLMLTPLLNAIPKEEIKSINRQDGDIVLTNGSLIGIRGSDRPDNLRGPRDGLNGVGMEEYSFHKEGVWNLIIRPQLADKKGKALFIGTPSMKKGIDYRDISEYAKSGVDKEWAYFHFTIYDNPHISKVEIDKIKESTSDTAWRQEYLAEFVEEEGPVYYDFKIEDHQEWLGPKWQDLNHMPCVVGIDWGLSDKTGVCWVHILPDGHLAVNKIHAQNNWTVARHCDIIKTEAPKRSNIKVYVLDSTAFRRDGDGSSSVAHEFMKEGIRVIPSDRGVLDLSIDVLKKFITGDGERTWLHIDKECRELYTALKNWIHGQHEPDICAALRFAVYHIYKHRLSSLVNMDTMSAAKTKTVSKNNEPIIHKPKLIHPAFDRPKMMTWAGNGVGWNNELGNWD